MRTLAKTLHDFADDVSDALRLVKGMAGEGTLAEWAGKSATVFKEEFSGVPKNLTKLEKSYGMCGDALADFWPKLERAQALADKALRKAREARDDLTSAQSKLSSADSWVTRASKEADKYKDDPTGSKSDADKPDEGKVRAATRDVQHAKTAQTNAQSAVDSAQSALDAAKKMAADARKMRDDAARDAKNRIDEASDAGIQNRSWWEDVGDWFTDNWDTIVAVCKVVVAVVGIVAMIIGGPILGAIVLVAALVVLADTLYKYSKGQASLWDVGLAALECIPGMKGLTTLGGLAKGLKGGMAAMKGIKGGLKGTGLALRGLGKNARGMVADGAKGAYDRARNLVRSKGSDPIDMATGAMYLPQTDVDLPGLLPLAFSRRVASDYRCGWWFGSTWASTVDQRLEVDEEGVVFVTEDGLLLTYPHSAGPGVAVAPDAGPRLSLTRTDDGGYRIDDPLTGHTRHFARPTSDGIALVARITDRNQHTITFAYDDYGTPLAIRHSGGYHLKLTTEEGRVTALSLAGAAEDGTDIVIKRYDYADGNLAAVSNSSGRPLRFAYDERARVTSWTDTNDRSYLYSYDDRDRCVMEGGEAGHVTISLDYDGFDPAWPDCRVTTLNTAGGAVSRFIVDDRCLVVAEIDPMGGMVATSYDPHQHVTSTTDQLGFTTTFVNNELGQPIAVTRPDGSVVHVAYEDDGPPTAITLPDGTFWQYTHDERGNVTAVTDPLGTTAHFVRGRDGAIVEARDSSGRGSRCENNAAGLPLSVTDDLGHPTHYAYTPFGRISAVTDPLGHVTRLEWTVEGQLARRTYPDGTQEHWEYDGEGNCVRHIDATGRVSMFEYTHFDRLSARTAPGGERYAFTHDAELRLTRVTNPQELTWDYTYDAAGRLLAETDFDGRTTRYAYDAAGRLAGRTNALGQSTRYERDSLGQISAKHVEGVTTAYTYTSNGSLTRAVGADSSLHVELDAMGRRISETVDGRTTSFAYDAAGNRTLRITPSGARSGWEYDAAGRVTQLTTAGHTVDFSHDAANREVVRRVNGALALTRSYDSLDRLTALGCTAPGDRLVAERSYTYRSDGYLTAVQDSRGGSRQFDLDLHGRVTAVHAAGRSERYAYDSAGNQSEAEWPVRDPDHEAVGPRAYTGTRLTRAGGVHYEHDALGRVIVRRKTRLSRKPDVWRYEWDAEDRLTAVVTPDGSRWRYTYDPLGRRTAKLRLGADGETVEERTVFTWDGNSLCEQTTEQGDTGRKTTLTWNHDGLSPVSQAERLWAVDAPQESVDERFFAIVTDLVGTPTELVSPDGEIAWHKRSTLWGTTAWNRDATAYTPLRFPGQYHDPETGLHYNHHRHYDPETARYTSPDPLGLLPAPNPMTYVHNPHSWSDPLGLAPLCHQHGGDTGSPDGLGLLPGPAPQHALDMLNKVNARPGGIGKVDGYHGNANWGNNKSALPGGKYKEWDVNAKVDLPQCSAPGCGKEIRGPERLLTPKDGPGPAYYTPDHYGTFYYVGEFTG
ncbi:RHS repeat-associated core domain-containing protein [Streptomyces sp. BB1-1-1]|nr:RHS repeat-associated core domain-containing protein [Streptomyces sp. BB1-1-1]WND37302.1 RHS repeat-associated core domain-containing protein [Streptomyces sp. BB1-1-1]